MQRPWGMISLLAPTSLVVSFSEQSNPDCPSDQPSLGFFEAVGDGVHRCRTGPTWSQPFTSSTRYELGKGRSLSTSCQGCLDVITWASVVDKLPVEKIRYRIVPGMEPGPHPRSASAKCCCGIQQCMSKNSSLPPPSPACGHTLVPTPPS